MNNKEQLFPRNRKEVFFDLVSHHKLDILKADLFLLLFALPTLLIIYGYYLYQGFLPTLLENGIITLPTGDGVNEYMHLFQVRIILSIALLFTNASLFIGFGGFVHILQSLILTSNEGKRLRFKDGIKKNIKQYLLISIVFSLGIIFLNLVLSYYFQDLNSWISIVSIVIAIALLTIIVFILFIAIPLLNLYKVRFFEAIKISFLLFVKKIYLSLPLLMLVLLPLGIYFVPFLIITSIFTFIYLFLYFPFIFIISILYSNYLFDEYINSSRFPTLYKKGMRSDDEINDIR